MKVVLADINDADLAQAEQELAAGGATAIGVHTDVSKLGDVEALAEKALRKFGAVHLLVNNAGVGVGFSIWETTWTDWEWVMGVNLWGVIYGIKVFVPIMLAQEAEGHIVNTASIAGFMSGFSCAPYQVTKHAVVALSEHLYYSLAQRNAKIKASVLCPGVVKTRLMDCERNRPAELQNEPDNAPARPEDEAAWQALRQAVEAGMPPHQVADQVFDAIRNEQFYILTHPGDRSFILERAENAVHQRNPVLP
jgi:NAD(P)-dependent dehydrogenase (short-subunit alcohol dehydrogenase family)